MKPRPTTAEQLAAVASLSAHPDLARDVIDIVYGDDDCHPYLVRAIYAASPLAQLLWQAVTDHYRESRQPATTAAVVTHVERWMELDPDLAAMATAAEYTSARDVSQAAIDELGKVLPEPAARKLWERLLQDGYRQGVAADLQLSLQEQTADIESRWATIRERIDALQSGDDAGLLRMDTVTRQPVEWLWGGRAAIGKITLIFGPPGGGKSSLTSDIGARVSRGLACVGDDDVRRQPGEVLILTTEDDPADTIGPRLDAYGADSRKIYIIQDVRDLSTQLPDLDRHLTRHPSARILIIDPITEFIGADVDSHSESDVRLVLSRLGALATKHRIAVVLILHDNKRAEGSVQNRAMGSRAYIAVSRTAWMLSPDGKDQDRVLMTW